MNQKFGLNVTTMTFHRLGKEVIQAFYGTKFDIAREDTLSKCITEYLTHTVYQSETDRNRLLDFMICYFEMDPMIKQYKNNLEEFHRYKINEVFESVKEKLGEYNKTIINKRKRIKRTVQSEYLKSKAEVNVANFLYLNGLEYEYEKQYAKVTEKGTYYHPDFTVVQGENTVYIEVLSVDQDGKSSIYNDQELAKYNFYVSLKKRKLAEDRANLILIYTAYHDHRPPLEHLKEELRKYHFVLKARNQEEIYRKLMETNINSYYFNFTNLVATFIQKCKVNEYNESYLLHMLPQIDDLRTKEFIKIVIPIMAKYRQYLSDHQLIDFDDMIIKAKYLLEDSNIVLPFRYQYIIIDEYQDISDQRFSLIRNLAKLFDSEIIAVGDDWQTIFSFAGSNVELFTRFQEEMGYGEILKIQNTYRNAQELIDLAGEFIEKNEQQIKKTLHSEKRIEKPVIIYSYDNHTNNTVLMKAKAIVEAIGEILNNQADAKILLLGRYGFDGIHLVNTTLFSEAPQNKFICHEYPKADISFYTVHRSKGLEFDYVIIINAIDSTYGFPSKVCDDSIFEVFSEHHISDFAYAEERRLFYVALTRTKNSVSIIVPETRPSPFVLEIKDSIHVEFKDNLIDNYFSSLEQLRCPKCNQYYLKKRFSKEVGEYVYECTADKELCDFKTNVLEPKINMVKCPKCQDGYLSYRITAKNGNYMIGCSNYNEVGESCNYCCFIPPKEILSGEISEKEKVRWNLVPKQLEQEVEILEV